MLQVHRRLWKMFSLGIVLVCVSCSSGENDPRTSSGLASLTEKAEAAKNGDRTALLELATLARISEDHLDAVNAIAFMGQPKMLERLLKADITNIVAPAIIESLTNSSASRRRVAAIAFVNLPHKPKEALQGLLAIVRNPDDQVNAGRFALEALAKMGPDAGGAIDTLNHQLRSGVGDGYFSGADGWRAAVARTLAEIALFAPPAKSLLQGWKNDSDPFVRFFVTQCLLLTGPADQKPWEALLEFLRSDDEELILLAVGLLRSVEGPLPSIITQKLQTLLAHDNPGVRKAAKGILLLRGELSTQ